jgi:hypothetical protein
MIRDRSITVPSFLPCPKPVRGGGSNAEAPWRAGGYHAPPRASTRWSLGGELETGGDLVPTLRIRMGRLSIKALNHHFCVIRIRTSYFVQSDGLMADTFGGSPH